MKIPSINKICSDDPGEVLAGSQKRYAVYQENELNLALERRGGFPTVKSDLE